MSVFQNRPYERHIVSNISTLLAAGNTIDSLGVGQIGIFDAKTNLSVTAPTYQANKAIYIAQGTPDRSNFPEGAGVPNMNRRTHTIQGKKLIGLRGKKASRGHGETVVLGNTGIVGDTKTLSAKPGETFYYYVRLTGEPIFNLNPDKSKGVIITGAVQMPCADECSDNCGTVSCDVITGLIEADWKTKKLPGGAAVTKYAVVNQILNCTPPDLNTVAFERYCVSITDAGDAYALGVVQAQYPGKNITRTERNGIVSTYCFVQLQSMGAPANFNQVAGTVIPNCSTCPAGATSNPALEVFQIKYDGDITGISDIIKAALAAYNPTVITVVQTDPLTGVTTFQVTNLLGTTRDQVDAALTALVASTLPGYLETYFVGETAPSCTLAASTVAWSIPTERDEDFCNKVEVTYDIFLRDTVCGDDLLAELTAAYAGLEQSGSTAIVQIVGEGNDCGHKYLLTTLSANCVEVNCAPDSVEFPVIPDFNGSSWTPIALAQGTSCLCGIQFTSPYVARKTKEATFDQFAYQTDFVHIEVSSHNPDWRSTDLCETDPISTRVQGGAYPNGDGQAVARLEKADRMYEMDYFYMSPVLREAFDFYFETKFDQFYDMVAVEYEFQYSSNNGFGQTDTDRYVQYLWLPETQAGNLITALNTYAASANINIDPIVL